MLGCLIQITKDKVKKALKHLNILTIFNQILRLRKVMFSSFYLLNTHTWRFGMSRIDGRIAVSLENKYTYIRIPKAANSRVCYNLAHHFDVPARFDTGYTPVSVVKQSLPRLSQLSYGEVKTVLSKHMIFTFVRNPYARVLSAYLDKFRKSTYRHRFGSEIKRYGKGELNFSNFCRWINDKGLWRDGHWMPQMWYINVFGLRRIDFIGKVENLQGDLQKILRVIDANPIERYDVVEPVFEHTHEHNTDSKKKMDKYYTKESRKIIYETYHEDFSQLGYEQ